MQIGEVTSLTENQPLDISLSYQGPQSAGGVGNNRV